MTLPIKQEHHRRSERTVNTTPLMPHRRATQENASAMAFPDGVYERGGEFCRGKALRPPLTSNQPRLRFPARQIPTARKLLR